MDSMSDTASAAKGDVSLTRCAAIAAGAGLVATSGLPEAAVSDDATALIKLAERKNAAFVRGDMEQWMALTRIASDFTLMQPFGGSASHGFDTSPQRLSEMARFFRNGETSLEVVQTHLSQAMIVLVMIERQQAEVGGLPKQDWSLRVTEVYRRERDQWRLCHRHADPLVRRRSLQEAASLARGGSEN